MSYAKEGFATPNLDNTEFDGDPQFHESKRIGGSEVQGLVQANVLVGQNLELKDEVMQSHLVASSSYKKHNHKGTRGRIWSSCRSRDN